MVIVFVSRTFLLWVALSLVIPFLIGCWTGLLWGGLVRIFLTHHVTWSVNSVCHTFGKREFETNDRSHNEWLVGLLGFGVFFFQAEDGIRDVAVTGVQTCALPI